MDLERLAVREFRRLGHADVATITEAAQHWAHLHHQPVNLVVFPSPHLPAAGPLPTDILDPVRWIGRCRFSQKLPARPSALECFSKMVLQGQGSRQTPQPTGPA